MEADSRRSEIAQKLGIPQADASFSHDQYDKNISQIILPYIDELQH
jgi:hypothetical protein